VAAPLSHNSFEPLLTEVEQYYTHKIMTHGATPLGVDWSCVPTQEMRFVQLLKLCDFASPVTLNDIGCGYGALLAFLAKRYRRKTIDYLGVDLSVAMIKQARQLWSQRALTAFAIAGARPRVADYSLASGTFNVKLTQPVEVWEQFVATTLTDMHTTSLRGFAVNFLAPLPVDMAQIPELYRVSPSVWSAYCEQTFGAKVEVVEGYGMREYTLLVRKP
jgi:SAM-dependent methyltransferase